MRNAGAIVLWRAKQTGHLVRAAANKRCCTVIVLIVSGRTLSLHVKQRTSCSLAIMKTLKHKQWADLLAIRTSTSTSTHTNVPEKLLRMVQGLFTECFGFLTYTHSIISQYWTGWGPLGSLSCKYFRVPKYQPAKVMPYFSWLLDITRQGGLRAAIVIQHRLLSSCGKSRFAAGQYYAKQRHCHWVTNMQCSLNVILQTPGQLSESKLVSQLTVKGTAAYLDIFQLQELVHVLLISNNSEEYCDDIHSTVSLVPQGLKTQHTWLVLIELDITLHLAGFACIEMLPQGQRPWNNMLLPPIWKRQEAP